MSTSTQSISLAEIAAHIDAQIIGEADISICGLGSLGNAKSGELSHLSSPTYRGLLADTGASAVILSADDADLCPCTALVVERPYLAFALASQLFAKQPQLEEGVHPSATIHPSCKISSQCAIGPNVCIGADTTVGAQVRIFANVVVGERCELHDGVTLHGNATLHDDVRVGVNSVIHSGAVVGGAGFGFTPGPDGKLVEIAQLGGVLIGADVSIGAVTSIDCGAIDDTVIEDGVKIDNQVQIGHNCHIGAHTLICGCVGIVGSTVIGKHCILAGGAGVGGDKPIELCDGVVLTAITHVSQTITEPGVYSGGRMYQPHAKWRRNVLREPHLDELFKRVKRLEKGLK